jgi:hypothetical protein
MWFADLFEMLVHIYQTTVFIHSLRISYERCIASCKEIYFFTACDLVLSLSVSNIFPFS